MEVKIPGLVADRVTALIEMLLPLLLVTEKAPAFETLDPAATVMLTDDVTATLTCARATPASPATQQAIRPINQNLERRFTASPPCRSRSLSFPPFAVRVEIIQSAL
jgi:hypothetical protein